LLASGDAFLVHQHFGRGVRHGSSTRFVPQAGCFHFSGSGVDRRLVNAQRRRDDIRYWGGRNPQWQ
jgi:hypothetical protein